MGRRKGEGSKYKRTINGKTLFVYEITRNGKKVSAYSSKSYTEAYRKLMTKLEHNITGEKILMKDLANRWLTYKEGKVKLQSLQIYSRNITHYVIPEFGEQYVHQITPEDIERLYASLSVCPTSIRRLNVIIGMLFKYAIKNGNAESNPTKDIELPLVESKPVRVLTEEECYHLLECAKGSRMYLPVRLALETGMRRGEILGLKYEDIHSGTITVERTVIRVEDSKNKKTLFDFNSPKNKQSRVITITPELEQELLKGDKKNGLVFASPKTKRDEGIWSPDSFCNSWILLREKAGFPKLRFHDLRHTHISHLLDRGISIPLVAQRAGHKNATTTLRIYAHVVNNLSPNILPSFAPMKQTP